MAGYVVDKSTAVQLRLIKAKKKAVKERIKRRINMNKFRDYSFRKQKRKTLPNHGLIENKGYRIDSRGEKQQLSAAKVMKSRGFRALRKSPVSRTAGGFFR